MNMRAMDAWIGAAMAAAILLAPLPAYSQANLSDQLVRTMSLARKGDMKKDFGQAFVDPTGALDIDPTASVADRQKTLLRRASLYELMRDFGKAEADLTMALELTSPPSASLYADRGYFYMRRNRYGDALVDFTTGMRLD